jgi:cytochrome c oxidase cbb3-type subunit 3
MMYKIHKSLVVVVMALMASTQVFAAGTDHYAFSNLSRWLFIATVGIVVIAALNSLYDLMLMYFDKRAEDILKEKGMYKKAAPVKRKSLLTKLYERSTQYVPLEKEKDILLDHNYDGIEELDNNLPPWWLWLFYITIAFSIFYVGFWHFSPWSQGQIEQYEVNMAKAAEEVKAYKALQGSSVDENNLEVMADATDLQLGESIFINNCAACHRKDGGGSVGPNLTDKYWKHGGSISDIYKTIKYGVPEKGMISWKTQLRPKQMHQVASYITTLVGTNPTDPKAPEGEEYVAEN